MLHTVIFSKCKTYYAVPSGPSAWIPTALRKIMHSHHRLPGPLGSLFWSDFVPRSLFLFFHVSCLSLTICLSLLLQRPFPIPYNVSLLTFCPSFRSQIGYHLLSRFHHLGQIFNICRLRTRYVSYFCTLIMQILHWFA